MKQTWTIPVANGGKRLDVYLSEELPELTRSQIAKLIKRGAATVNGRAASVHRFLKTDDTVIFDDVLQPKIESNTGIRNPEPAFPLRIIDETPDYLIINKSTGLLVHPDVKTKHGTLVDLLVAHDPKIAKLGEDPERPGIVHRLDREVSGLMIIPRTQDAFDNLKQQFAEHSVDKRYLALVYGEMNTDEGEIKFRIARSKTKPRMAARPEHEEEGRAAWTHYKTLKKFRNATLLELTILSGRTHQVRAHLLALNHPVIGDPLYKRRAENRNITAPRLMLQSVYLSFKDPTTGIKRAYTIPPVHEFDDLMKQL